MAYSLSIKLKYPELEILSSEECCDVVFIVNGRRIAAHSQFLSVKSIGFRELFNSMRNSTAKNPIVIPVEEVSYLSFRSLIRYLYCDEFVIQDSNDYQLIADMVTLSGNYKTYLFLDEVWEHINSENFLKEWSQNDRILKQISLNNAITKITRKVNDDNKHPERDYFMNEDLSDVVFLINKERIPALKQLLKIKSRVFKAMFSGNFIESNKREIEIPNISVNAFKEFIHFLYFNEILFENSTRDDIYDTFELLDMYEILRIGSKKFNPIRLTRANQPFVWDMGIKFNLKDVKYNAMIFANNYWRH